MESSPVTQTMQVASVLFGLVSTQALLISCSTHSVKLPFFQKAAAVVVIVRFKTTIERREGAYARDKLNIQSNAPSLLLSKSSVQKGGAYFWELTVLSSTRLSLSVQASQWPGSEVRVRVECTLLVQLNDGISGHSTMYMQMATEHLDGISVGFN